MSLIPFILDLADELNEFNRAVMANMDVDDFGFGPLQQELHQHAAQQPHQQQQQQQQHHMEQRRPIRSLTQWLLSPNTKQRHHPYSARLKTLWPKASAGENTTPLGAAHTVAINGDNDAATAGSSGAANSGTGSGSMNGTSAVTKSAHSIVNKNGFQVSMNVKQFAPNELNVKTINNCIIVEGKHEDKEDGHGVISRHFIRKYMLPKGYDPNDVQSTLSSDGILTVKAPPPPPPVKANENYERIVDIQRTGPAQLAAASAEQPHQQMAEQTSEQPKPAVVAAKPDISTAPLLLPATTTPTTSAAEAVATAIEIIPAPAEIAKAKAKAVPADEDRPTTSKAIKAALAATNNNNNNSSNSSTPNMKNTTATTATATTNDGDIDRETVAVAVAVGEAAVDEQQQKVELPSVVQTEQQQQQQQEQQQHELPAAAHTSETQLKTATEIETVAQKEQQRTEQDQKQEHEQEQEQEQAPVAELTDVKSASDETADSAEPQCAAAATQPQPPPPASPAIELDEQQQQQQQQEEAAATASTADSDEPMQTGDDAVVPPAKIADTIAPVVDTANAADTDMDTSTALAADKVSHANGQAADEAAVEDVLAMDITVSNAEAAPAANGNDDNGLQADGDAGKDKTNLDVEQEIAAIVTKPTAMAIDGGGDDDDLASAGEVIATEASAESESDIIMESAIEGKSKVTAELLAAADAAILLAKAQCDTVESMGNGNGNAEAAAKPTNADAMPKPMAVE